MFKHCNVIINCNLLLTTKNTNYGVVIRNYKIITLVLSMIK